MDEKLTDANSLFRPNTEEELEQAKKLVDKFKNAIDESNVTLAVAIKSLIGGLQSYINWWDTEARNGMEQSGTSGPELVRAMFELHIAQYGQIISLLMYRNDPQNALEILARCMEFETARLNAMKVPEPEEDQKKENKE